MSGRLATWASYAALVSVLLISLFGFILYLKLIAFFVSFLCGAIAVMYLNYDKTSVLPADLDYLDNPLEQTNFSIQLPKVLTLFESDAPPPKFDQRITGSETVDSFLNEIVNIVIANYVSPWYEVLTANDELKQYSLKHTVQAAGANLANRVKCVDWVQLLATRFPEELTTHLKLFKQARVRMKHIATVSDKELNGNTRVSPKKGDADKKPSHRRNKSETDAGWFLGSNSGAQIFGKSKFYASSENLSGKTLKDVFFDLECIMEDRKICRDTFCLEPDKEYALLCELSEAVLYLIAPEELWKCTSLKLILIDLLAGVIFKPLLNLLSDPDNINRLILRTCCKDTGLPSELFLIVIRCCEDAEELDATLELVQKEVQKLHSRDSGGECELPVRQQLSSLHYLTRVIHARRAALRPQELSSATDSQSSENVNVEVQNCLQFLSASSAWRSHAQYLMEMEMQEAESSQNSKAVLENLRSTALEICDTYLAPNKPGLLGVPENAYNSITRKITAENEEFVNNPVTCFDDLQKSIFDALEEVPVWQTSQTGDLDFDAPMSGNLDVNPDLLREESCKPVRSDKRKYSVRCKKIMKNCLNHFPRMFRKRLNFIDLPDKRSTFPRCTSKSKSPRKTHTLPKCTSPADTLPSPSLYSRHNRSRSDIVGASQRIIAETAGISVTSNVSQSHPDIEKKSKLPKASASYLQASIIETALVQDKGKTFGIYAVAVTRLADNEVWHIYRRYSDFYDLHSSVNQRWPELAHLPFPGKKTFQNTSRSVLERRKMMLNSYLQNLCVLSRQTRYADMLTEDLLGGFLSQQNQERQSSSIDAVLVNSLRAGMRTLKSMPDQLANTVDGVMDGISKVFQGKTTESYSDGLKFSIPFMQDDAADSVALRLLEEALGLRGMWLRRHLLAPVRTLLADHINKKVLEHVSNLTSPRNVVQYLKYLKQWLLSGAGVDPGVREPATKARARVAAKVALLAACSDELRHIVGTDTARRGLLTVFQLFQTQEINKRLIFVLLEATMCELFPDNHTTELFRRLYSGSARVHTSRKQSAL